jgi:hypothetical protein
VTWAPNCSSSEAKDEPAVAITRVPRGAERSE